MGARITGKAMPQTGEHGGISANSALSRWLARAKGASGLWLGTVAYALALAGTLLLKDEPGRGWGVLMLLAGGLLAVAAWHGVPLPPALPREEGRRQKAECRSWRAAGSWASPNSGLLPSAFRHSRAWLPVAGVSGSVLLWGVACALYVANPGETFGPAGWVWLLSMALLAVSALAWDTPLPRRAGGPISDGARADGPPDTQYAIRDTPDPPAWTAWEVALFAGLVTLAAVLRLWDLSRFPDYIFGDEIFEGHVAIGAYIDKPGPSVFGTLWDTVNLPALWFFALASSLKVGGVTLWALRLPAALFGAATAIPFYGLVRGAWGRSAAIFGTAVFAFSAANVHYSRVTLNNIVTPFFWTVCFFFLLRGLRYGRPAHWAGAGLAAGLSEYGHFGTRLLPFILLAFAGYLLVFHRAAGKRCLRGFGLLALGYVIGFGPLLADHALHPESYLGRGVDMLTWDHVPTSWQDLQLMWSTLWPLLAENLLGFSTHSSQDLIYFAPLLLPAEAALLVLGAVLLAWHWRHPPAFLMLMSGCGVLLLGGTLVLYKGGLMPYIAHWAPAFPVFYATLALPAGIWAGQVWRGLPGRLKWAAPGAVAVGVAVLAWVNITFYFHDYYANPRIPGSETYRAVAHWLEVRTAQSRYQASLGPGYKVRIVGRDDDPLNPDTRYLVSGQDWARIADPEKELRRQNTGDKPLALIFFPGTEQHLERALSLYPGGTRSEVRNRLGDLLFYTYGVSPTKE